MQINSLAHRCWLASLIAFPCFTHLNAQVFSVDAVGFAGTHSDYFGVGPGYEYHAQNLLGPIQGNWIGQTGIHDVSSPGIGTVGVIQFNANGGHTGVYEHLSTEQTIDATDRGYVSLSTRIGTEDFITINGQPRGTVMNVELVFSITGELAGDYGASLSRAFSLYSGIWGTAARLDYTGVRLENGAFNQSFIQTVQMRAGYAYTVSSEVTFSMSGFGVTGSSGFSTLDSTHSSNIRLYPEDDSAEVSAFSGFDYTSAIVAVPESSANYVAAATLSTASAVLCWIRRQRRR